MAMGRVAYFGEPGLVCRFWAALAPGYEQLKRERGLGLSVADLGADELELVCPEFHGPAEHSIRMLSQLADDPALNAARVQVGPEINFTPC